MSGMSKVEATNKLGRKRAEGGERATQIKCHMRLGETK